MVTFWRRAEAEADGDELRSSWEGKFELCCIIANSIHNTVSTYIFFYDISETGENDYLLFYHPQYSAFLLWMNIYICLLLPSLAKK